MEWWDNKGPFISGVTLKPSLPTHSLFTDMGSPSRTGRTPDQSVLHINVLEMKAILLALKQCHQYVLNSTVMIATDNSSVVSYLKREGGTHSPSLCMEVWETLQWCNQKEINLLVRHIPGKSNILADRLSRLSKPISTECLWIRRFAARFCRDLSQQEVTNLCVSYPRRKGSGDRCNVNELERNARLCVFSVCSDSSNNQQDSPTSLQHSVDSSSLGRNVLVSGHSSVSSSTGHSDSLAQKSVDTIGSEICQGKRRKLKTSCLEFIRRSIRDRKFSANVARHAAEVRRSSTRRVYDAKWKVFFPIGVCKGKFILSRPLLRK